MTDAPRDLREFCLREHPRLVRALDLHMGDLHLAEDIAQDALMVVCRKWERVSSARSPSAYAHRIAFNLANSHFRRRRAEARANRRIAMQSTHPTDALERVDDVTLRDALAALPRRQRTAVVMHHYLGYPLHDIAPVLGTTVGTVKSLLHRARARLRQRLEVNDSADDRHRETEPTDAR